jgi:hypothetical protein
LVAVHQQDRQVRAGRLDPTSLLGCPPKSPSRPDNLDRRFFVVRLSILSWIGEKRLSLHPYESLVKFALPKELEQVRHYECAGKSTFCFGCLAERPDLARERVQSIQNSALERCGGNL